jgi:formiminotetrahydrofolate cyclodeaminase
MTPYQFEVLARKITAEIDHPSYNIFVRNDFTTTDHAVQLILTVPYTVGASEFINLENISEETAKLHIEQTIKELAKRKEHLDAAMKIVEGTMK